MINSNFKKVTSILCAFAILQTGINFSYAEDGLEELNTVNNASVLSNDRVYVMTSANNQTLSYNIRKLMSGSDESSINRVAGLVGSDSVFSQKQIDKIIAVSSNTLTKSIRKEKESVNKLIIKFIDDTVEVFDINFMRENGAYEYSFVSIENLVYSPVESKYDASASTLISELKNVAYTDQGVKNQLEQQNFRFLEITAKKQEIAKRKGVVWTTISDEEAKQELKAESLEIIDFERAFNSVKLDIENIVVGILESNYNQGDIAFAKSKISNNKEKFLVGLSYLQKLYNFNFNEVNLKDLMLYNSDFYGKSIDIVDFIISLGSQQNLGVNVNTNNIIVGKNVETFNRLISNIIVNQMQIDKFLELNHGYFVKDKDINEWFKSESKAFIVEKSSNTDNSGEHRLYTKLLDNRKHHLLVLLGVPENTIYAISNPASITYGMVDAYVDRKLKGATEYEQKLSEMKEKIEYAADRQQAFIDFWYRIAKDNTKPRLNSNRIQIDTQRILDPSTQSAEKQWAKKTGPDSNDAMKSFIIPLRLDGTYVFVDGVAEGENIRLVLNRALEDAGISTYTHELTHILEEDVWFNNNAIRDGLGGEFYARGMFESSDRFEEPILNLNLAFEHSTPRYQNQTPERFKEAEDLKTYMQGVFDVIYTLEYAEAKVVLDKDSNSKQKWYNKIEAVDVSGQPYKKDRVVALTTSEASTLLSIDDLVDKNIIAERYEVVGRQTTGEVSHNGYYSIPLFTPIYSGLQNTQGASGDITSRRVAHEILAEFGYYEGMVPYISNQLKQEAINEGKTLSDAFIINKISGGKFGSIADFKKEMYKTRIDNSTKISPITISIDGQSKEIKTFDDIVELMNIAVEKDYQYLSTPAAQNFVSRKRPFNTEVEKLKEQIYLAYKKDTSDFKTSIYKEEAIEVPHVINNDDIITETIIKGGAIDLSDNIQNLPEGSRIEVITTPDNNVAGDFVATVKVIYKNNTETTVQIPVKIKDQVPAVVINLVPTISASDIKEEVIVKGEALDLRDNVQNLPQGARVEQIGQLDTNTVGNFAVEAKVIFADGSSRKIQIPVKIKDQVPAVVINLVPTISASDIKEEVIVKGEALDLRDNVQNLPQGARVEQIGQLDTNTVGNFAVEAKVIFADGSSRKIQIPVKIKDQVPAVVINPVPTISASDIKEEVIVKGGRIDLRDNIQNLPQGARVEQIGQLDTNTVGDFAVEAKVIFEDGSSRKIQIPVKIKDQVPAVVINPVPTISAIDIKEEVIVKGGRIDLRDNIQNLPQGARVEQIGQLDTNTVGNFVVEAKVIFADGSSRKIQIPVKIKDQVPAVVINLVPTISASDIKEEVIVKGEALDLRDNVQNLPQGARVEQIGQLDTNTVGNFAVEAKVIFADGSSKKIQIPVKIKESNALNPIQPVKPSTGGGGGGGSTLTTPPKNQEVKTPVDNSVGVVVTRPIINGYPDGTFKPSNSITRAETASILSKFLKASESNKTYFADVKIEAWYNSHVNTLVENSIVDRNSDTFRPNDIATRAEVAVMIAKVKGLKPEGITSFKDKNTAKWAEGYINVLVKKGIIDGYPDNTFRPNQKISRSEMVKVIVLAFGVEKIEGREVLFKDIKKDHWAFKYIEKLV